MKSKLMPDLSQRPFQLSLQHQFRASAAELYRAWTERFDLWFTQPGELLISPEIDRPWFFYNRKEWGSHAHYGRFLESNYLRQSRGLEFVNRSKRLEC